MSGFRVWLSGSVEILLSNPSVPQTLSWHHGLVCLHPSPWNKVTLASFSLEKSEISGTVTGGVCVGGRQRGKAQILASFWFTNLCLTGLFPSGYQWKVRTLRKARQAHWLPGDIKGAREISLFRTMFRLQYHRPKWCLPCCVAILTLHYILELIELLFSTSKPYLFCVTEVF